MRRLPPLYPFALSFYAPLALAAANAGRGVSSADLVRPLTVCAAVAALAVMTGFLVTPDRHKRGLIAAAIVVFVATGGLLAQALGDAARLDAAVAARVVLPSATLALLLAVWMIRRTARDLSRATAFMNVASGLLLAFPALAHARTALARQATEHAVPAPVPPAPVPPQPVPPQPVPPQQGAPQQGAPPDIYYIVLDSYSSGRSLAALYGHDNAAFEAALEGRGFVLPRDARANYVMTFLSLAAALNWQYLDDLPRRLGRDAADRAVPHAMIENSRAVAFLKRRGYKLVFFPTSYSATGRNRNADVVVARSRTTEFQAVWFRSTSIALAARVVCADARLCGRSALPFEPEGAAALRWKFRQIAAAAHLPGPKVILAHMMVPHEPFVFRRDCSERPSYWPQSTAEDGRWRAAYAEQVACVNREVLTMVDSLLGASPRPPVIILQGDHGHGRFPLGRTPALREATGEQINDRARVFAAYHLPAGVGALVHDSLSPVNVWPLVLTHYFGVHTPPLPDATYWSAWERPYDFTRIR